jgi:glycosyltransferase involved in cell wall biosynthesis
MGGKHILFISSWYPNRNNPTHGIFNRYFAEAVALYNKVSVLHVCSDEKLHKEFELIESNENKISTVTVYYKKVMNRWPVISGLKKKKKLIRAFEMGYRLLVKNAGKPDLIHLNVVMPLGIGARYLSLKYDIPYVVNENWSGYTAEDGNYKGFILKYFTSRIIAGARAILPTSQYLKEAMLSHGLKGKYFVIPNVVDVQRFKPPGSQADQTITTLLHISSLNDREKNVSGIIRAFATALHTEPALQLSIVGQGVDEPVYRKLAETLGIEQQVFFRGRLRGNDLVQEIQACDALVMFSNYETFCLVNIEAFACGKPVITSNAGAIPGYMRAELGLMVEKGDEQQLSEAIHDFPQNKHKFDPVFIRQYAVDNFSYEKVGKDLDAIYHSVLNKQ